jgi:hypothetical protein
MGGDAEASAHIEFFNSPIEPDIAFLVRRESAA